MTETPFFIVELALQPSQVEAFRSVMHDLTNAVRADEPGTLEYEAFVSSDRTAGYILERYADDAAALAHSKTFPEDLVKRSQAFMPTRLSVFGKLSDEVREHRIETLRKWVPGISVVYYDPVGGLVREPGSAPA
jgi:quinol monooxygenase YgiN